MIRLIIRILSFIGFICGVFLAISLNNKVIYLSCLGFVFTFLGTFVKPNASTPQNIVSQKGGAFSTNTQNNNFGVQAEDKKK